jgi:hypothetical protein
MMTHRRAVSGVLALVACGLWAVAMAATTLGTAAAIEPSPASTQSDPVIAVDRLPHRGMRIGNNIAVSANMSHLYHRGRVIGHNERALPDARASQMGGIDRTGERDGTDRAGSFDEDAEVSFAGGNSWGDVGWSADNGRAMLPVALVIGGTVGSTPLR